MQIQDTGRHSSNDRPLIAVTGATGYVGGRLLRVLEERGYRVRCLARRPERLKTRIGSQTTAVAADVLDFESLRPALVGVHTAYYLVHSMSSEGDFVAEDRLAARNFGRAAREAGVKRIVYLGGLGAAEEELSSHLNSRQETGDILRLSGIPVIELRASIVIGSGSLSFEMVRALVERLPVMVTPRWVEVMAQPIAIDDLLAYLVAVLDLPAMTTHVFEIGGRDRVSYGDIMREYARQRGLRRTMVSVPVLTPRLSSLWLGLVTPLYARIGRKLIDGVRHATVVRDASALHRFPIRPRGYREAIAAAMRREDHEIAETRWCDALSATTRERRWGGTRFGNRFVDSRTAHTAAPVDCAFTPIRRIGGRAGWYAYDRAWRLRGALDVLVGGVGMRRGRRHPDELEVGDTLDCWRVEVFEADRRLRLAAEMKLPGRAWLEFEVEPDGEGASIRQTAIFDPIGLWGQLYWYVLYPVHNLIFAAMLRRIALSARDGRTDALPDSMSPGPDPQVWGGWGPGNRRRSRLGAA